MSNYLALFIIASILNAFVTLISSTNWKIIELRFCRLVSRRKRNESSATGGDDEDFEGSWRDCPDEPFYVAHDDDVDKSASNNIEKMKAEHSKLLHRFLKVYVLASFADWLQGPYVYDIYDRYGYSSVEIATLFVCGFASSMIFGSFIGGMADAYGRRKFVVVFSIIYSLSCMSKHFSNYIILVIGRLLGGIASSLLFSVFDSWLIRAHTDCGLDKTYLSASFSYATYCKFFVAIVAGLIGNKIAIFTKMEPLSIDRENILFSHLPSIFIGGCINVFDLATASATLCGILATFLWDENYGSTDNPHREEQHNGADLEEFELKHGHDALHTKRIYEAIKSSLLTVFQNREIFICGSVTALVEGSIFIFVFLWTPTLTKLSSDHSKVAEKDVKSQLGLIFATFMVSCMTGSFLYSYLKKKMNDEILGCLVMMVASISLFMVTISTNNTFICICFNVFETCVGIYFPLMGTIKSKIVPENQRVAIYNVFRIPLNMIVLISLFTNASKEQSFLCCAIMLSVAALMLERLSQQNKKIPMKKNMSYIITNDDISIDSATIIETRKGPVQKHLVHRHPPDS